MKDLEILRKVQDLQAEYVRDVYMDVTTALQDDGTLLVRVYAAPIFVSEGDTISLWIYDYEPVTEHIRKYNQLCAHLDYLRRCNQTKKAV